jgi:hypothetical protein
MTRPKRVFAELLVKAQGGQDLDVDDICERLTLADIMYELKKLEKETEVAVSEPEPEPVEEIRTPDNFWSRLSPE